MAEVVDNDIKKIDIGWKLSLVILTLLFNASTIVWLNLYGKTENLLHQNSLSWSYISGIMLIGSVLGLEGLAYINSFRR